MARIKIPLVIETTVESETKGGAAGKFKFIVPVKGATVTVKVRGGAATKIFEAETGNTTLAEPVHTDEFGNVPGWLNEGSYVVTVEGGEGAIEIPKTDFNLDLAVGQGDTKAEVETKLTSAEGKISTLETSLTAAEAKISTLEGEVSLGSWSVLTPTGNYKNVEGVGLTTLAVRKEGHTARLRGELEVITTLVANGTEILSAELASEFRPTHQQRLKTYIVTKQTKISQRSGLETTTTTYSAIILVESSGAIKLYFGTELGSTIAQGATFFFDGLTYPLD